MDSHKNHSEKSTSINKRVDLHSAQRWIVVILRQSLQVDGSALGDGHHVISGGKIMLTGYVQVIMRDILVENVRENVRLRTPPPWLPPTLPPPCTALPPPPPLLTPPPLPRTLRGRRRRRTLRRRRKRRRTRGRVHWRKERRERRRNS